MSNIIRIKRRLSNSGSGTALPTGLRNAELAFNEVNNTLYIGRGGTNTEVNADGVVATPIIGEGAVWQGTATFGNVKTTGYVAVGDEAYAYTNTFPPSVDSAQGGKLLASTEYVDSALARGTGSGMSLFPVAADVATTVPIVAGNYYDNLQGLGSVRVAIPQPSSAAAGLALYELKGTPTVQGVNLVANDRVLIMGHLDPTNIGIWTIPNGAGSSTPWVREAGLNVAQAYTYGARVFVTAGDNANKTFAVASDPLNPTKDVGGPNFNTLSFIQHSTGSTTVPAGANIKFKRVVRAKSDYYQIIAGKVVVDGVVLNQNDRFIWTPKNENPGGHNPVGYTVGDGTGDESGDYDSPRAGIYRVNYDRTLDTNPTTGLPDFYSVVVRAGDFNDDIEAVAAHNTKVLVREGATNANKIFTITTNASSFIIDDTFPGEVALFGYDSNWTGAAGSLSGTPIIDGVQTVFEDLTANPPRLGSVVLVKNEVDQTTNGLYYIKTNGAWERHSSANETGELAYGSYIRVKYGTINKNSGFVQVANFDPLIIGTHPIVFESPQALLDFRAGVGLGRDGRSFYVKTASTARINVTEVGVDLAVIPDVGGNSVETNPAEIGTAYLAVHADKYGRVLASSRDSLTADELRNKIVGVGATDDTTGTQHLVFSESPALTGVPTAPTADANTSTTQIATTEFVMSNGGTSILGTNNAFTGANTFTNATGQTFRTAATADAIIVKGGGNTNGRSITLITDTLSGSRTVTFPDHSGDYTLVGVATTQTLTNKTLTAPKMTDTHIADANGNELIVFPAVVASAVNEITVTNAIASTRPTISATGADTNIDLALSGKGTGTVFVNGSIKLATANATSIADVNGNEIIKFPTTVASAVNEITVTNAAANAAPDISATGGDTNINLKLTAKGSGVVNAASDFTVSSGKALNRSTAATITAAGTTQATAFALTNDINVVSTAAASTGVALPTGTAGRRVVVINRGENAITVYPASGGTIDALALNAGMALPVNAQAQFYAATTTQWYSETVRADNVTGTLAVGSGGTGATTFTSNGIIYGNGSGALQVTAEGTDIQVLQANASGVPTWVSSTGTGNVVRATSPTLVTPTIGAATATSINKVSITAPANAATLVIADGKTLTASNTLTFTGTDSSSVAFGAGGTVPYVDIGKTNQYGSSNTFFISDTATFKLQKPGPFEALAFEIGGGDDAEYTTTIKTVQTGADITLLLPYESGRLATQAEVNSAIATAIGYVSTAKASVLVATTANITLSGAQIIDGVATVAGDRVLVKNQTTGSANGIYVVAAGAWARSADLDISAEAVTGVSTYAISGTINGGKSFVLTTTGAITLGTTALTFENLSTAAVITAGNGLTRTGNTLDVVSTGNGSLTVGSDTINLTSGIATAGTYRSVTVDTYGRVTAGTAPTTFSDYGISDTSANLAAALTDETGFTTGAKAVFSTSPSFETSVIGPAGSFDVFNTASTTINAFGGATTALNIGPTTTAATAVNIASGAMTTGTRTINIGTGATGGTSNVVLGSTGATSTVTINKDLVVSGNLTINGTTTTINASTLTVDDKNIELGSVAAVTGITGTIASYGGNTATITGLSSTAGLIPGMALTKTAGTGTFGGTPLIANIDSATQITVTSTTDGTTGTITFNAGSVSDDTANEGGIILRSTADKTWRWLKATAAWTSSEDINLVATKVYEINGATVLSATTLGGGVTASSLTSVGTLTGGELGSGFTTVAVGRGGTGQTTFTSNGVILGNSTSALNVTAAGTANQVLRVPADGGAPAFGAIATDGITDNAVSFAKLPNSAAAGLSVVGRSANSAGNFAEINAGTDGHVLRRSGTALGFGTIATAGITDAAVTSAKLRNSDALSVIGRSANDAGVPADIAAATDGQVLRRSGTTLGFGTIATAGIADNAVSFAKLPNSAAAGISVVGRSANSAGNFAEIASGTDGHVLRQSGTTLGFGTIATAGLADGAVTNAKVLDGTLTASKFATGELCTAVSNCTLDGGTF